MPIPDPRQLALSACVLIAAVLVSPALAADAELMDQRPLADSVAPQVRDCRALETLQVPMRSTGGDIVTLYATGVAAGTPEGAFADHGIDAEAVLQNDIRTQLAAYLACETPLMKASQAMLNAAADLTEADPRTEMVALFQFGWSNGGDALVARPGVSTPADLSGATLVVQAHGPQLGYLARVLADAQAAVEAAGGTWTAPTLRHTERLLGLDADTPGGAFLRDVDIDAAFVTRTDAEILTAGGVGTGAEGSVQGARVLLSTKSASRVISDALVVRRDYLEANGEQMKALAKALFEAEERLREDVIKQLVDWPAVAAALLGDGGAVDEAKALWRDYETVGLKGNIDWAGGSHPRAFQAVNNDIQSYLVGTGLLQEAHGLAVVDWDYRAEFGDDIFDQRMASLPGFDDDRAAGAVDRLRAAGDVASRTLFTLEIRFRPNQFRFPAAEYADPFAEVAELASTYAGAVLTVEGHADPLKYLKTQHGGGTLAELQRIRKSAENLSWRRATAVRDAIIAAAAEQGVRLDASQFVATGLGIAEPKSGTCGKDPCPPKTEAEWRANMRVAFRLVNLESEAAVFTPPNEW